MSTKDELVALRDQAAKFWLTLHNLVIWDDDESLKVETILDTAEEHASKTVNFLNAAIKALSDDPSIV